MTGFQNIDWLLRYATFVEIQTANQDDLFHFVQVEKQRE